MSFFATLIELQSFMTLGDLFHSLAAFPINIFRVVGSTNFPSVTPHSNQIEGKSLLIRSSQHFMAFVSSNPGVLYVEMNSRACPM